MKIRFLYLVLPVLLLACGCATTRTIISVSDVGCVEVKHNPVGNTFSIAGHDAPPFPAADIVKALKKAKIPHSTEIRIIMDKLDNQRLVAQIAELLINGGDPRNKDDRYPNYAFFTAETADSYKTTPGAERDDAPPVVRPRITNQPRSTQSLQGR